MANEIERHGGPLTDEEKGAFLRAYVEHRFNFRAACEAVGRHFTTMYRHLRSDAKFRAAFEEVRGALGDVALAEAVRRAIDGVEKPVFHKGERVDTVVEYSDALLLAILRATRPEFRDAAKLELSGPDGGPIELRDEAQVAAKLAAILYAAKRRMLMGDAPDVIEGEIVDDKPSLEDLV